MRAAFNLGLDRPGPGSPDRRFHEQRLRLWSPTTTGWLELLDPTPAEAFGLSVTGAAGWVR